MSLLTYLLGWSTLLSARTVVIDGTQRVDEIQSQISQTQFHLGEPLARVDVHSLSRKIALLDWVENESVKRDWFHARIHVSVVERTPVAQYSTDAGKIMLIDKNGQTFRAKGSATYPRISFATFNQDGIQAIAVFVQSLPADLLGNLSSISLRSLDSIVSTHTGIGNGTLIIRWGSKDEIPTKIKVLRALLKLPENAKAKVVDLSSPLAPIIK